MKRILLYLKDVIFFVGAKGVWMVEYPLTHLQYMPSVMMSSERWMIVLKTLEREEMKAFRISTIMTLLDEQKMCCHHSLKDCQVHTGGSWWKLKKYCLHSGIINYSQGCIFCLEPLQIWIFSWRQIIFLHQDLLEVGKYVHTHFQEEGHSSFYILIYVNFIPLSLNKCVLAHLCRDEFLWKN